MIDKARGIVLHQVKYSDSGIVVHFYTNKFGRQSFLIKGMRNKKEGKHNIIFQPMFILDMVIYYKESRNLQSLKEFSTAFSPSGIYSDVKKSCVAIFLGEVLTSVLREENPNEELFNYIESSIIYFDECNDDFANFHIAFLAGLASYLGFEPTPRGFDTNRYFDMLNGCFVSFPPSHGNYAKEEISDVLSSFFNTSFDKINNISLNGNQRNEVLDTIIKYYSLHLPGLKKINSIEVLKEVFR
jgi:DNA repair protein RecO (recombination protein O)